MMNTFSIVKAALLGALQGATEFLPVSSSGHLVIAQQLLGVKLEDGGLLAFDVCLHLGTLLAVLLFFWREIWMMLRSFFLWGEEPSGKPGELTPRQGRRVALLIIVGTIPAGIVGPLLDDVFERIISSALSAAVMLLLTGAILWSTRWVRSGTTAIMEMTFPRALLIGAAQALAIIPGISRSGSTIAAGLFAGLTKDAAARFAFLLAIPAIAGATLFQLDDLAHFSSDMILATIVGTAVAAVVGFACIAWLLGVIRRGHISWFAPYCWALGLGTIAFLMIRG